MQAYCVKCRSKKGNKGAAGHNNEEWEARNSRCLSSVWDKDVQDRKGITTDRDALAVRHIPTTPSFYHFEQADIKSRPGYNMV